MSVEINGGNASSMLLMSTYTVFYRDMRREACFTIKKLTNNT